MSTDLLKKIDATCGYLKAKFPYLPSCAVILGTGLGDLSAKAKDAIKIPYSDIPGFSISTTESHAGNLILGKISGIPVLFMEGRFHYYEGYTLSEVTFPIRVMAGLGIRKLFITNAAGGMNPQYQKGDMVVITDHINLMGVNPLVGKNDPRLGLRFPDMIAPYSQRLISLAQDIALKNKIPLKQGIYIGVTGPCLETRAEYRFMRLIGGDLVGMSTVPEVIVAVHAGIEVFGLSCVTDLCLPDALEPANIDAIIATAKKSGPVMDKLLELMITSLIS